VGIQTSVEWKPGDWAESSNTGCFVYYGIAGQGVNSSSVLIVVEMNDQAECREVHVACARHGVRCSAYNATSVGSLNQGYCNLSCIVSVVE
jgi:hypothetical protein